LPVKSFQEKSHGNHILTLNCLSSFFSEEEKREAAALMVKILLVKETTNAIASTIRMEFHPRSKFCMSRSLLTP